MKKLLLSFALFVTVLSYGQITPMNIVEIKGITTAARDGYTPPVGSYPVIYNTTTGQHERWNGSSWEELSAAAVTDGNDFLTSVTNVSGVLTFVVSNQTDPTIDLNGLDNYTGAELETKLDAYFGSSAWRTQDGTGTDSQTLSFAGPNLSISGGNSVDLSALQDGIGTDDQNASEVALTSSVNGETNVQASLEDHESRIDALAGVSADGVVTNIELSGTTLVVDGTGGAETVDVDLSSLQDGIGTDDQYLTLAGNILSIENGNSVNLSLVQDGTGTDDQTASEVTYSNSTSLLAANDAQDAIDEIEARVDTNDAKVGITPAQASDITANNAKISYTDAAAVSANTAKVSADGSFATHSDLTKGTAGTISASTLRVLADHDSDGTYDVFDWTPPSGSVTAASTTYDNTTSGLTAVNVKSALDELDAIIETNTTTIDANTSAISTQGGDVSSNESRIAAIETTLSGPATSTFTYTTKSTGSFADGDQQDNDIIEIDGDVTLDAGVFAEGEAIRINHAWGATTPAILEGTGVEIRGYAGGIQLDSDNSGVTLSRRTGASSPEIWQVVDAWGSISINCNYGANEFHLDDNAASQPVCKEVNGTTGWTGGSNSTVSSVADPADASTGAYAIQLLADSAAADPILTYSFTANDGDTFDISFWVKEVGTSGAARVRNWDGWVSSPFFDPNTTWSYQTFSVTASGTGTKTIEIDAGGFAATPGDGDGVVIDGVTITKTN